MREGSLVIFIKIIFAALIFLHELLQELLTQLFDPKTMKEDEEWLSGMRVRKAEDIHFLFSFIDMHVFCS